MLGAKAGGAVSIGMSTLVVLDEQYGEVDGDSETVRFLFCSEKLIVSLLSALHPPAPTA